MLLAPVVWVLTVVICLLLRGQDLVVSAADFAHGIAYDAQFMRTLVVAGIIFFLAQFALGYVIVRFRERRPPRRLLPRQQQAGDHLDQRHRAAVPRPGADGHQDLGRRALR